MIRCLVFDRATADAIRARTGLAAEIDSAAGDPASILQRALQSQAAVALVPTGKPGKVLLMHMVHRPVANATAPKPASNLAPAGFLGLSDAIDMDSEPSSPNKWWQKLLR